METSKMFHHVSNRASCTVQQSVDVLILSWKGILQRTTLQACISLKLKTCFKFLWNRTQGDCPCQLPAWKLTYLHIESLTERLDLTAQYLVQFLSPFFCFICRRSGPGASPEMSVITDSGTRPKTQQCDGKVAVHLSRCIRKKIARISEQYLFWMKQAGVCLHSVQMSQELHCYIVLLYDMYLKCCCVLVSLHWRSSWTEIFLSPMTWLNCMTLSSSMSSRRQSIQVKQKFAHFDHFCCCDQLIFIENMNLSINFFHFKILEDTHLLWD